VGKEISSPVCIEDEEDEESEDTEEILVTNDVVYQAFRL
jgi:hypothetical protein